MPSPQRGWSGSNETPLPRRTGQPSARYFEEPRQHRSPRAPRPIPPRENPFSPEYEGPFTSGLERVTEVYELRNDIRGVRENILANAVLLFPAVVERHRAANPNRPPSEAFHVVIRTAHEHDPVDGERCTGFESIIACKTIDGPLQEIVATRKRFDNAYEALQSLFFVTAYAVEHVKPEVTRPLYHGDMIRVSDEGVAHKAFWH